MALNARVAFVAPRGARNMATLKDMERRLKGVKNMQKITKAMKMVAQSKLRLAEKNLMPARRLGEASSRLNEKLKEDTETSNKHLVLAVTSDRGLCGGVNSTIAKSVRKLIEENKKNNIDTRLACLGDKGRLLLSRQYGSLFTNVFNDFGKLGFNYTQASYIADELLSNEDFKFDKVTIVYNKYVSVVSYDTTATTMMDPANFVAQSSKDLELLPYDQEGDPDVMQNYQTAHLANSIYAAFSESFVSEQSARMNAMEGASKNAGEMIGALQLKYNRTRQAVITRELIEIISGASAL